jgi:hypothetical protein
MPGWHRIVRDRWLCGKTPGENHVGSVVESWCAPGPVAGENGTDLPPGQAVMARTKGSDSRQEKEKNQLPRARMAR